MDSNTDLQNLVQNSPQQAQTNPPSRDSSIPSAPETAVTQCPSLASNTNAAEARVLKGRITSLSKTFGHIPDVPIFTRWDKRMDCSLSAVHRSIVCGIMGSGKYGAYSIALSGLYEDDEDGGDVIIYTGEGGRERWTNTIPPKRNFSGPLTEDQSWERYKNKALIVSFHTGNPVRVIRSWKCPSQYAPLDGYRYDGLYKITAYWTGKGRNGKKICRCRLERLPDQPPIPLRQIASPVSRRHEDRFVSRPTPSPSTSTAIPGSFFLDEVNLDMKVSRPPSDQCRGSPQPGVLPTYKWYAKKQMLVPLEQLPASHPEQEGHRGEDDDATFVSFGDGHIHERVEMQCLSDEGN